MSDAITFPQGFFWGAATAAHQTEGNNVSSDWWGFEHAADTFVLEPSGDACDSFHRYRDDIALLAASGLDTYRFSIEWARIEPEPGAFSHAAIDHYRRMVQTCRDSGVRPVVTLHHFTNPRWMARDGGWRHPEAVQRFARFTEAALPVLEDVEWVVTFNEPNLLVWGLGDVAEGAASGPEVGDRWRKGPDRQVAGVLAEAHRASREVLSTLRGVRSGWTVATQAYEAAPGAEDVVREWAEWRETFFLDTARGDDFLGVQAYTRNVIGPDGMLPVPEGVETTLTGWEYFPPALGIGVRHAWERSGGTPIMVTENGIATADDSRRIDYTRDALAGLAAAMDDGVEVLGYLHWSLLDNYEWGRYAPTFGLVSVDRTTFRRTPKPSLAWLGEVATSRSLPAADTRAPAPSAG